MTPLASVVLYGVHHGADVAVNDSVFGFIVFLVCAEFWVKPHFVSNGKIVVHMPPTVLFHDGPFLARVGVDNRGIFRIGSPVVVLAASMLAFLLAVLIDDHPLPHGLFCSSQPQQVNDQHDKGNAHADDKGFTKGEIVHQQTGDGKADERYEHQYPHTADGVFFVFLRGGQYLRAVISVGKADQPRAAL
ncbi:hypothetical protein SDC9_162705 [bioreactor metagenome]|uniref:Uncharacterized protein n=1 Tax=bioreactor metagenome TaxID=1076179 RepID=A0A645FTM3_9ZZZZ